ncbi:MAG: hypothetical protein CMO44_17980 [Verrucomicrobiales bacterium]|nr:hypothetical protein [Verrucomicrobiales bacterium]
MTKKIIPGELCWVRYPVTTADGHDEYRWWKALILSVQKRNSTVTVIWQDNEFRGQEQANIPLRFIIKEKDGYKDLKDGYKDLKDGYKALKEHFDAGLKNTLQSNSFLSNEVVKNAKIYDDRTSKLFSVLNDLNKKVDILNKAVDNLNKKILQKGIFGDEVTYDPSLDRLSNSLNSLSMDFASSSHEFDDNGTMHNKRYFS